jgi:hypothetical protein
VSQFENFGGGALLAFSAVGIVLVIYKQPHSSPTQASRPSLTSSQTIVSEPMPSIHHAPNAH